MKSISLTVLVLAMGLSGCANLQQSTGMDGKTAGAVGGGVIGCVGGAVLAKLGGGNAVAGCAVGAVAGGLVGFEKARQDEIAAAEQARNDVAAAFESRPGQKARVGQVKTGEVTATQKGSSEARKYQAFDSVSVELPLASKGSPEHDAAMEKLKALAERVADERGSSQIIVALAPADAKARKVASSTGTAQTAKGNTITVIKTSSAAVSKGLERITVKAGNLQTEV